MPAGRPFGSTTKKTLQFREALRRYAKRKKVDPHQYMIDLIADDSTQTIVTMSGDTRELPTVSRELKFQAAKEVAQYLEPKLRATEISGDPDRPLIVQHYEVTLE